MNTASCLLRRTAMKWLIGAFLVVATQQSLLPSQSSGTGAQMSFDVTSVKPNPREEGRGGALQPGRFAQTSVTLRQLIRMAYGTSQTVGGPSWVDSDRFDVDGRGAFDLSGFLPGPDGSPPRVYVMLQRLLEERFKLALHKQVQERPVYALVVARHDQQLGPRLQRSAIDCDALIAAVRQNGRPPAPPEPGQAPNCSMRIMPGHLVADSVNMSQLAGALTSPIADRVVLDRTGLIGRFNVELEWTPDLLAPSNRQDGIAPAADAPPSLFTAVQEQLGLKLDGTTAPIEVLVVDRAEQPTAN